MYHCDCQANRHYWDLGRGLQQWAKLNFHELKTEEKCLRSENPAERLSFERYQQEIDAGRPVLVTFSFDKEAAKGLKESCAAQGRLSVLGIGYEVKGSGFRGQGSEQPSSLIAHPSSLFLIVQVPDGLWECSEGAMGRASGRRGVYVGEMTPEQRR